MHHFPTPPSKAEESEDEESSGSDISATEKENFGEDSSEAGPSDREAKYQGEGNDVELWADSTALFGNENEGGRGTGSGTTIERLDRGLSSTIGNENRDGYGKSLSGRQRHRANRLRRWQRRSHQSSSRDRSLRIGLDEIRRMGTALGTGKDIRRTACQLFRQATENGLLVGRSIEGIASASVYIGARTFGYPRSLDEIAHVSRVERNHIVSCYTTLRNEFELELAPVDPKAYLPRTVTEIDSSSFVEQRAQLIIEEAQSADGDAKSIIGGASPKSIAAAAVYAAAVHEDRDHTQTAIADAADVHVSTIRNNYRELLSVYQSSESTANRRESG